jgi:tetratricopeptide (TPR) repeat protein
MLAPRSTRISTLRQADRPAGVSEPQDRPGWEKIIAELMAEAGAATSTETRVDCLREAAAIYERRLDDLPRALVAWQTAFAEAPASDDVALAVERVTQALGCWEQVLPDTESLLADVTDPAQRTALLTWLARWLERFAHDEDSAVQRLVEAAELSPGSVAVAEALCAVYRRHGEWARAATVLARTGEATSDREEAVVLLLEAARLIQTRVGDAEGAAPLYRRVLELKPGHGDAAAALAELTGPGLDPEAVCQQYRRTLEKEPDDLRVIRQWADVAFANNRWIDVRFLFEKVYARLDATLAAELARRPPHS